MRTLRLSLTGTVILALLGGLGGAAVVAQDDEEEAPTATYVTGGEVSGSSSGPYRVKEMDWSDPRLPSQMRYDFNIDEHVAIHPDGPAIAGQMARTYRLDGPDGTWTGTGRVLGWMTQPVSEDEHRETWIELLTLSGEGAYEGLSATLVRVIYEGDIGPYEGYIFEGAVPPFPHPIGPSAD